MSYGFNNLSMESMRCVLLWRWTESGANRSPHKIPANREKCREILENSTAYRRNGAAYPDNYVDVTN